MDRYQLQIIAQLYGVAVTVAGQNPHHPAYEQLLTPGERGAATAMLDQIVEWMERGFWPGEAVVESMNVGLTRLHHELFERWQYQLEGGGNGHDEE